MKEVIEKFIINFIQEYEKKENITNIWKRPIIKFGDATLPEFAELREVVHTEHFMPEDILVGARIIITYFIPYKEHIGVSNIDGELNSKEWAIAYEKTAELVTELETELINYIQKKGYRAKNVDEKKAFDKETSRSRWSQRHVARYCGLGTFGINNMLITDEGCCGRIGSIITNLIVDPDIPIQTEYCLNKKNGTCGQCIKRCPVNALSNGKYEVMICRQQCDKNRAVYHNINTCGKCTVGVPCTFKKP